jgi:hypothetical protein
MERFTVGDGFLHSQHLDFMAYQSCNHFSVKLKVAVRWLCLSRAQSAQWDQSLGKETSSSPQLGMAEKTRILPW